MQVAEENLRRSIAAATDARARARLRVELAAVVRARDPVAARDELTERGARSGPDPGADAAPRSRWRGRCRRRNASRGWAPSPGPARAWPFPTSWSALAGAQIDADQPRDAARTLLALVRDERLPLHHRRAAASKLVRICDRVDPIAGPHRAVRGGDARHGEGAARAAAAGAGVAPDHRTPSRAHGRRRRDARADRARVDEVRRRGAARRRAARPPARAQARVGAHDRGGGGAGAPAGAPAAAAAVPRQPAAAPPKRLPAKAAFEAALAEAGRAIPTAPGGLRRRRSACRGPGPTSPRASRPSTPPCARVVRAGSAPPAAHGPRGRRRRGQARGGAAGAREGGGRRRPVRAGGELAAGRRGGAAAAGRDRAPAGVAGRSLPGGATVARAGRGRSGQGAGAAGEGAVAAPGRRRGARARREAGGAGREGEESSRRRLALLRAAPRRRIRAGAAGAARAGGWRRSSKRWATRSARWRCSSARSRSRRPARVRACAASGRASCASLGRPRELAAALEKDAGALLGDARLPVLAEQAELLEAAGESERALDVRMMALAEFPGAPAVLDDARARLEATGRPIESLALAIAALDHTTDRTRRLALLRDVAMLSEQPDVSANPGDAANAWLAVLGLAAADKEAAAAAERLLRAVGDWERCADLLAWQVARAAARKPDDTDEGTDQVGLIWRLAELRRERLGEADEALRLYGQLATFGSAAAGPRRFRRSWRRWCAATSCSPSRPPARAWRRRRPIDRGRWSIAPRCCWRAAAGATPNATRSRRSISIRATPRRSGRWRRCTTGSGAPASSPRSWAAGPPAPAARCGAAALRPRAGLGARRDRGRRAKPTGGRWRSIRRSPSRSPRSARWPPAKATGPRSPAARERGRPRDQRDAQGPAADRAGGRLRRSAGRFRARGVAAGERRTISARRSPPARSGRALSPRRWKLAGGGRRARPPRLARRHHRRRGRTVLRGRRGGRGGGPARSRAHPVFALLRTRQQLSPDAGAAVHDLLRARAVGQRLEGDGGAARTPRRRARAR